MPHSKLQKIAYFSLILFLILEVVFAVIQHYQFPLDGDLANIVLPDPGYQKVLDDPFGWGVIWNDATYPATNRFFAHWFQMIYFKNVPLWLQAFVDPINSIYLACALAKTVIQFILVFVLGIAITSGRSWFSRDHLLASVLISPLFQTFGYNGYMGIIDPSITYTFFYAFASLLLFLFFLPFYKISFHGITTRMSRLQKLGLLLLTFVVPFHGPLNAAVILIVCPLVLIYVCWKNFNNWKGESWINGIWSAIKAIPSSMTFFFILISALSLYSFYIGRNNSENYWVEVSILERYAKLPLGVYYQFTQKLGLPLLLLFVLINSLLINRFGIQKKKLNNLLQWIGILSLIYLLLLPLGGYREYRPNIVRRDTIMPILLALFFYFGLSTYVILKSDLLKKGRFIAAICLFEIIFLVADAKVMEKNSCEKETLQELANSVESEVLLEKDCTVMSWRKIEEFDHSKNSAALLYYWGIMDSPKSFKHK